MTDWATAAASIHAAFADPILYSGGVLSDEPLTAVKSDVPADGFQGAGSTARHVSFEIRKADLPVQPGKGHVIEHTDPMTGITGRWSVIERVSRDDVGSWELTVEKL